MVANVEMHALKCKINLETQVSTRKLVYQFFKRRRQKSKVVLSCEGKTQSNLNGLFEI